jgi:hypothetical protein
MKRRLISFAANAVAFGVFCLGVWKAWLWWNQKLPPDIAMIWLTGCAAALFFPWYVHRLANPKKIQGRGFDVVISPEAENYRVVVGGMQINRSFQSPEEAADCAKERFGVKV